VYLCVAAIHFADSEADAVMLVVISGLDLGVAENTPEMPSLIAR
jgi:hypothetical protein